MSIDIVGVIGSSPTNPTSEKSLVDQGFFRFLEVLGLVKGRVLPPAGATMISEKPCGIRGCG